MIHHPSSVLLAGVPRFLWQHQRHRWHFVQYGYGSY
jgi:hypothetical protein